ncbi:MAG: DMT family transporter [Eubacteriales bacterium]|nr:DMT family transporter [Eubacteriales bacterium]
MKTRHTIYLFVTAMIWGAAFVAQSAGNVMGPFTFNCLRNILGVLVLIPFIRFFYGDLRIDRLTLTGGILCGFFLFLASNVQQMGLLYTTPGKAGFITASYMILVPIVGIFFGKRISGRILTAVVLGALGLYFLCIPQGEGFSNVNRGDLLCMGCALLFTGHIMCIDHFVPKTQGVKMSCIQFFTAAVLSGILMLLFETPDAAAVKSGLVPLLYAGIMSTGVAYSMQIVGQNGVDPSVAALILSLESCFAVLAGWVLMHNAMSTRELAGCALMFGAIILTQLPQGGNNKA